MSLKLAYCDHKAASYAVENWHYSKRMPLPPLVNVGVWEDGKFIGVVIFGRGAANNLGDSWGLEQTQVSELVRVALTKHKAPVSKIVAVAIRLFKKASPGIKLLLSFADPEEGHHGGIYQAMGWGFVGNSATTKQYFYEGRWQHNREVTAGAFGGARKMSADQMKKLPTRERCGKHRYALALTDDLKPLVKARSLPYPKRGSPKGADGDHPTERRRESDPAAPFKVEK